MVVDSLLVRNEFAIISIIYFMLLISGLSVEIGQILFPLESLYLYVISVLLTLCKFMGIFLIGL